MFAPPRPDSTRITTPEPVVLEASEVPPWTPDSAPSPEWRKAIVSVPAGSTSVDEDFVQDPSRGWHLDAGPDFVPPFASAMSAFPPGSWIVVDATGRVLARNLTQQEAASGAVVLERATREGAICLRHLSSLPCLGCRLAWRPSPWSVEIQ